MFPFGTKQISIEHGGVTIDSQQDKSVCEWLEESCGTRKLASANAQNQIITHLLPGSQQSVLFVCRGFARLLQIWWVLSR